MKKKLIKILKQFWSERWMSDLEIEKVADEIIDLKNGS